MSADPVEELRSVLSKLWSGPMDSSIRELLPSDVDSINSFYPDLQDYFLNAPRRIFGTIDPAALVAGDVISMGQGSVIEAGAIIHESCRLIMGNRSTVRGGAVLRGEVFIGDDCMIGTHSELMRSLVLGPDTSLGHHVVFGDSIIGAGSLLSGFVGVANTHIHRGKAIGIDLPSGRVSTSRVYLGTLVGDRVRIGVTTTICPGAVILGGLDLPPGAVLLGLIDERRCRELTRDFFARWGDGKGNGE